MRIVLVTDSHLAPEAPACNENWKSVREYVARVSADLTVHLGDISLDAAGDSAQLDSARGACDAWPSPFRFVPGNHDVGDNPPGPAVPAKHPLVPDLLERYRALFGPDHWSIDADQFFIVGLNAQLFGTGHDAEREQWQWLDERAAEAGDRPLILMLHKPLFQRTRDDEAPHIRYVPHEPRQRLLSLLVALNLKLVFSGHTHQYLDRTIEGVRHVWIPSTAFYLPDSDQERIGEKVTGVGVLEIDRDSYRFDLVSPEGVKRNSFADQPFYSALK